MEKRLLVMALLGGALTVQAQQVNGSFDEEWVDCVPWTSGNNKTTKGMQPLGWTVSHVIGVNGLGATEVGSKVEEGYEGTGYALQLRNSANSLMASQIVPAYVTLGTSWSTSVMGKQNDGGTFGGVSFTFVPDALRFFYKRSHGETAPTEPASVVAYLWKGTYTQSSVPANIVAWGTPKSVSMIDRDRNILGKSTTKGGSVTKTEDATCIATIEHYIEGDATEWTECLVPFKYDETLGVDVQPEKLNIILSANDYFGGSDAVGKDNMLIVDEVSLVYYSQLASLSYNGTPVAGFDKDTYVYNIDETFDESKLQYAADGKGASATHRYDAATGKCVIRVEGNDISANAENYHEYTINFVVPVHVNTYANTLSVNLLEMYIGAPQSANIEVTEYTRGVYGLSLKNFMLEGLGGVGNIEMIGLTVTEQNGAIHLSGNKKIAITPGDDPNVEWMGPDLTMAAGGAIPVAIEADIQGGLMTATININFPELGVIKVVFAPELTISDEGCTVAASGLHNVVMQRQFKQGWNTVCLPFATTPAALGAVSAQAFHSADDAALNFVAVEELVANTPYLLFFENAVTDETYTVEPVEAAAPISVTHGDFTFTGTYEPVSMAGKYGVAKVDGVDKIVPGGPNATVKGTRAYFTTTKAGVKEMALLIDGVATGVDAVEAASQECYDVYTPAGVQVRKGAASLDGLRKGLYIVNGKKMIIK